METLLAEPTGATPPYPSPHPGPIQILSLRFGGYPEADALNPAFVAGSLRMKLTLDVHPQACSPGLAPADLLAPLAKVMPGLGRHRCCGGRSLNQVLLEPGRPATCAMSDRDVTVDAAHLLEHLIIDLQHSIARMRACSGVTCGHHRPPWRYDLFVESPGRAVSRLSLGLAHDLLQRLLLGAPPDPLHASLVMLSSHVMRDPSAAIEARLARQVLGGDPRAAAALEALRRLGFIEEIETSINFSRMPIFRHAGANDDSTADTDPASLTHAEA